MGGLRLLTLDECEQVAKLPAYFTGEELSALLTWMVDKNSVITFPDTICIVKVPRNYLPPKPKIVEDSKLVENEFELIPDDVFPKYFPDFQFKGFHKALKTFTNVINVVPNKDILFTSYMCRSGLPKMPPTIRFDYSRSKLVKVEHEEPKLEATV
jgi:hypothetical protein